MTEDQYEEKLDELMKRILRRLTLLSDGKASVAPDARGGSPGKAGDVLLRLGPPDWGWDIRSLRNRYGRAHAIDTKRTLIADALSLLLAAKVAPWRPIHSDRHVHKGNEAWRKIIADDPRHPDKVASRYGISRATVYNCRKEFARRNGKKAA